MKKVIIALLILLSIQSVNAKELTENEFNNSKNVSNISVISNNEGEKTKLSGISISNIVLNKKIEEYVCNEFNSLKDDEYNMKSADIFNENLATLGYVANKKDNITLITILSSSILLLCIFLIIKKRG